ncbi:hypothetical protein DFH09DRAFT_1333606 [Mycena vulgaris]|nr:hypothetical protein DFH09DRAFT_1333606 [Mycena vulgaris]
MDDGQWRREIYPSSRLQGVRAPDSEIVRGSAGEPLGAVWSNLRGINGTVHDTARSDSLGAVCDTLSHCLRHWLRHSGLLATPLALAILRSRFMLTTKSANEASWLYDMRWSTPVVESMDILTQSHWLLAGAHPRRGGVAEGVGIGISNVSAIPPARSPAFAAALPRELVSESAALPTAFVKPPICLAELVYEGSVRVGVREWEATHDICAARAARDEESDEADEFFTFATAALATLSVANSLPVDSKASQGGGNAISERAARGLPDLGALTATIPAALLALGQVLAALGLQLGPAHPVIGVVGNLLGTVGTTVGGVADGLANMTKIAGPGALLNVAGMVGSVASNAQSAAAGVTNMVGNAGSTANQAGGLTNGI